MYWKNGQFWLVKKGKWTGLGADRAQAFAEYEQRTSGPKTGSMPDHIDRVLKLHFRVKKSSQETINAYTSAAKRLKDVFKNFNPNQVKPKHVAALFHADSETPSAANRNQTVLKVVMNYLFREGLIEANPVTGAEYYEIESRERYIETAEFWKIHAQADERLQVIMELCFQTGQRIRDVLKIKFDDLREDGIYFKPSKTKKKQKVIIVEYTDAMRATLERAKALLTTGKVSLMQQGYLLRGQMAHKRHRPPAYTVILNQWTAACKAAGVQDAHLHDLRAKAGTDAKKQGKDAQALLAHSSERQTAVYLRGRDIPVVQGPDMRKTGEF